MNQPTGFFSVERHVGSSIPRPPWLPLADLAHDPTPLLGRIAAVRQRLTRSAGHDVGQRVAAATVHLGLVARFAAAGLANAVTSAEPLDMSPHGIWWQQGSPDPVPLTVTSEPTPTGTPAWLDSASLVTDVVARRTGCSPRILCGNVASGINTAAVLLARQAPATGEAIARQLAVITRDPRLRGEPGPYGPGFRRRSCCLAYRAGLGYCGDCVLTLRPRRASSP